MNRFICFVFSLMVLAGCDVFQAPQTGGVYDIIISPRSSSFTKSKLPEEKKISDMNLFIFNSDGVLEEKQFMRCNTSEEVIVSINLQKYKIYDMYAVANMGRSIEVSDKNELMAVRHWMAYADDWSNGLVMAGKNEGTCPGENSEIEIPLERIMSKVMVSIDRSGLDDDVDIHFVKAGLVNCPGSGTLFKENVTDNYMIPGFVCEENQTSKLNGKRISEEIAMYCIENMATESTYVELDADYNSNSYYTKGGTYIKYMFYPGKDGMSRNHEYHICLKLSSDGLGGDRWRLDKSALIKREEIKWCVFHPSPYIECERGDTVHLWCEYGPETAEFEIDREFLAEDTGRGIYDYRIDDDGKGISLFMKSKGTGIVMFDLGEPINEEEMYVIVCEP